MLIGLIIGHRTLGHVNPIDWLYLIVLYGILMFVRLFIIAVLFPFLGSGQNKCTVYEAAFMSWAG